MHNPIIPASDSSLRTPGVSIDIFHCAYDTVENWNDPVLRDPFWRCYVPTTDGAALVFRDVTQPMKEGTTILIPPDTAIRGTARGPFALYFAHFNCSLQLRHARPYTMDTPVSTGETMTQALSARDTQAFAGSVMQLVATALGRIPVTDLREPVEDSRIRAAHRIMRESIDRRMTNAELAAQLHMSEASLLRLFRDNCGISPQKEHLRLRLGHAAQLLLGTDQTIDEIADACGFWDRNHFTRVFTREWHDSPARYRRSATTL